MLEVCQLPTARYLGLAALMGMMWHGTAVFGFEPRGSHAPYLDANDYK